MERDGLGIHCTSAEVEFEGCAMRHNRRGALSCWDQSTVGLLGCTVASNNGGLSLYGNSNVTLRKCTISNNFYMDGGGIKASQSTLKITECAFEGNRCNVWGGAIFADHCDMTITHCTFIGNHAAYGGGIYSVGDLDTTKIVQCTFVGNDALQQYGGGLWLSTRSELNSSIVAFSSMGGGIHLGTQVSVYHCDVFGNTGGNFTGQVGNRGQIIGVNANGDPCDMYYNIFLDPLFADTSIGDLHLLADSPCIDAGDPLLDLDNDGTTADIGAFYYDQVENSTPAFILHPSSFILSSFPNPFNPTTTLSMELVNSGKVSLRIFDLLGREVSTLVNAALSSGSHQVNWNAQGQPSGVYFAVLETTGQRMIHKLVLLK
jgi:parallel beta-helix repeat protein/predicted outer membrane repeat protein